MRLLLEWLWWGDNQYNDWHSVEQESVHWLFWDFLFICLFCKLRQKSLIKLLKIISKLLHFLRYSHLWTAEMPQRQLLNLHLTLASQLQSYLQYILTFCYQVTYKVCFSLQLQSCLPVSYQCLLIKAIFPSPNIEQFRNNVIIYVK